MDTRQRRKVAKILRERIAQEPVKMPIGHSCVYLERTLRYISDVPSGEAARLSDTYAKLFMPVAGFPADGPWLHFAKINGRTTGIIVFDDSEEKDAWRRTALCLFAAMIEVGDV